MRAHISFEELTAYVWMDTLTEDKKHLALRINQHLLECDQCYETLQKLQGIRNRTIELERRQVDGDQLAGQAEKLVYGHFGPGEFISSTQVYAASFRKAQVAEEGEISLEEDFSEEQKEN